MPKKLKINHLNILKNDETYKKTEYQVFHLSMYEASKLYKTSILDVYALTYLQNKPKNLHESISFRYHLYLLTL